MALKGNPVLRRMQERKAEKIHVFNVSKWRQHKTGRMQRREEDRDVEEQWKATEGEWSDGRETRQAARPGSRTIYGRKDKFQIVKLKPFNTNINNGFHPRITTTSTTATITTSTTTITTATTATTSSSN